LDDREIVIKTKPGQVIHSETHDEQGRTLPYIMTVSNEGMPSLGNPFVRGNLYVVFHVKFPDRLAPDVILQLRDLLPNADMGEEYDPEVVEEHFLDVGDLRHFGKGGLSASTNEYDSDDEDGQGQQGVQCQQS
jgi:DnaJ homolog subfamily A member 2